MDNNKIHGAPIRPLPLITPVAPVEKKTPSHKKRRDLQEDFYHARTYREEQKPLTYTDPRRAPKKTPKTS